MIQFKKYLLLFLLFNSTLGAQVTITNSNLKIDNTLAPNSTIGFNNLNSSITISLKTQLETPDNSPNNTFGNLFLYYKKSTNDSPTQVGFQSITFVNNYPKTNYISEINFNSIILYKKDFPSSGGILYAEYKNNNNKTFQSSKIAIINGTITTPTPPTVPTIPPQVTKLYIATKNIRYSDNFPIVNSKILTTNNNSTYLDVDVYLKNVINESTNIKIYLRKEEINSVTVGDNDGNMVVLKNVLVNKIYDNYLSIKDIEINPNNLDFTKYKYTIKIDITKYSLNGSAIAFGNDYIEIKNKTLNIISAKPISYNIISDNQNLMLGQLSKPFTTTTPSVDFTIPCNRRGCMTIYDYRDITTFQWQTRTQNTDWTDIQDQTLKDYSPNKTFTENTYYRRIAFYNDGQYSLSNIISISLNNQYFENTICCNQTLTSATSQPQEILGNAPELSNFTYQWQICKSPTASTPEWTDLPNAINQNLKHIFPEATRRGSEITGFRRQIKNNSLAISTSNSINITGGRGSGTTGQGPGRRSLIVKSNNEESKEITNNIHLQNIENTNYTTETNLSTYPNPTINNFYIKNTHKFKNPERIKLFDSSGNEVKISKTILSDNLIEVNIHPNSPGIYILHINEDSLITKKIIKN